ncbi:hypothetical protein [Dyadobacter subterraneus]|nr:hypothetical protein [Dyadobacter subterraneus]
MVKETTPDIPGPFVETVIMTDLNTKAGTFDIVTDTIAQLTGRPPASLKDFLKLNASRFITIDYPADNNIHL